MSRFFSLRFTLLLGLYLVAPFAIRTMTSVKAWPAILFPVGAGKLDVVNGTVAFLHLSFRGFDPEGHARELDPSEFFAPISIGHAGALADYELGLSEAVTRPVWVRKLRVQISVPRHVPPRRLRTEVAAWWSNRLRNEGLSPDRIALRHEEIIVDVKTGREISRRSIDERIIALR